MTRPQATQALLDVIEKIVSNSNGTSAIDAEAITVLTSVVPLIAAAPKTVLALDDDYTLDATEDHDKLITMGTDAKTITLPATVAGSVFRFANVGADANNIITISPDAVLIGTGVTGTSAWILLTSTGIWAQGA